MYSRWADQPDYDPSADPPTTEWSDSESECGTERIEVHSIPETDASIHSPSEKAEVEKTFEIPDDSFADDPLVAANIIVDDGIILPGDGSGNVDVPRSGEEFGAASGSALDDDAETQCEQMQQEQKPGGRSRRGRLILLTLGLISLILGVVGFAVTALPQITFILLAAVFLFIFCILSVSSLVQ